MKDKRRFPRIPKKALVSFEKLDDQRAILEEGMGRTRNLSLAGLNLELTGPAGPGDIFLLVLNVDGALVEVVGRVVWSEVEGDATQVGFEILKAPPEYGRQLDRLFLQAD